MTAKRQIDLLENGAPGAIRTPDPQIRSLVLYPAELRVHSKGAEPIEAPPRYQAGIAPFAGWGDPARKEGSQGRVRPGVKQPSG
jgi:hypothetical protein